MGEDHIPKYPSKERNKLTSVRVEGKNLFPQINLKGGCGMNRFKEKIFSIGEAARMSGVSIKQIRHWEDKGYIPTSDRVVCGERSYRKYGHGDLELIQAIKAYLDEGYTLPVAAKLAAEKISKKGGRQR
jgi:hypothetical protein